MKDKSVTRRTRCGGQTVDVEGEKLL